MTTRRDFLIKSGSWALLALPFWRSPRALWQLVMPTAQAQGVTGPTEFFGVIVSGGGINERVPASAFQAGVDYTLQATFEPRSHRHPIVITAAQWQELGSSGSIRGFKSQEAQGHSHDLRVQRDPNAQTIPNIQTPTPSTPPTEPGVPPTDNPSKNSDNTLAAILGEGQEPYLYVEALQPIDSSTIYYCLGDEGSCSRLDWVVMEKAPVLPGRRLYKSKFPLKVRANDVVHVSATDNYNTRKELHLRVAPLGQGLYLKAD